MERAKRYLRLRQGLTSVRRFLGTGNLLRFLVALVLAFGLWAWVTYQNDPEITRTIGGVPVAVADLDEDLELVGEPPIVDVTIQGPQSIVAPLDREVITAVVDMSEAGLPGRYERDVSVDLPSGIRVRDVVPEPVEIEVDQMSTRDGIPLQVIDPDDVPPNYQVDNIEVGVEEISAVGPQSALDRIDHAELEIQIDGRTSTFSDSIEPRLVDEAGEEIENAEADPGRVNVTVTMNVED